MEPIKYYISGPMSGLPNHNYDFFEEVAVSLRADGMTILSPHEVEDVAQAEAETGGYSEAKPYGYYLAKAVIMLCQADEIIMLPGWTTSKGARREFDLALDCEMPIWLLEQAERIEKDSTKANVRTHYSLRSLR